MRTMLVKRAQRDSRNVDRAAPEKSCPRQTWAWHPFLLNHVNLLAAIIACVLSAGARAALAAGQVGLEVVTEERVSLTAQQEWGRRLAQAGLSNVRFRTKQVADKMEIRNLGTESAPLYQVVAVLAPDETLLVPGARFRASDVAQLKSWLDDMARNGPLENRPAKTAFGLEVAQFQQAEKDLSQLVGFPTAGVSRQEAIRRILRQLSAPVRSMPERLPEDDKVVEELGGLSCGTALACLLRPIGLCLIPQAERGGVNYSITASKPGEEVWPVGWPPEKRPADVVPGMMEFLNANVQGVPVTKVIDAVCGRLKLPVLWDRNALARWGIDAEKAIVNLPKSRTTYSILLRKALFQAHLKSEVRMDEAGHPFVWITTIKPI